MSGGGRPGRSASPNSRSDTSAGGVVCVDEDVGLFVAGKYVQVTLAEADVTTVDHERLLLEDSPTADND